MATSPEELRSRNALRMKKLRENPEEQAKHTKDSSARYNSRNWKALGLNSSNVESFKRIVVALLVDEAFQRLERRRNRGRRYAKSNPEKIKSKNLAQNKKHAVRILAKARKRRYGLTTDQYLSLYEFQKGTCQICNEPLPEKYHTDHCHKTGIVRGLLCRGCNMGLGMFKDSPQRLKNAASYLEKFVFKTLCPPEP